MGTPLAKKSFVVDLGGPNFWMDCDYGKYISSSFKRSQCGSAPCSVAKATCGGGCLPGHHRPACNIETCHVLIHNKLTGGESDVGVISLDKISLQSTQGSKAGPSVAISDFIFACAYDRGVGNLARGANGMVGLGRDQIALPTQLSSAVGGSLRRNFAICLPSTSKSNGVIFFGDSPYVFYPGYNKSKAIDVSSRFQHTQLYINTGFTGSSVVGGTKISTVEPYSKLETTIHKALVKAFDEEIAAWNASKVAPVAPFTDCYTVGNMGMTVLGIGVPDIAFVLEGNKNLYWEMYGANSMVEVSRDVICLPFLDAGDETGIRTSIVMGAHQLQDNLLQFDIASNRLSFTSTLLLEEVECSNFKF
ncbi:hypothetical protein MANES_03G183601v8 [Manihot esculenta]|uniref:Uncharacterized protein n=1 Tax=Manihot esculenta TaxID=3983 RepID=A0ACB7I2U1_MANES|nr:hypothetical protein MANES_03G183601v8 [Manihot esculenta]